MAAKKSESGGMTGKTLSMAIAATIILMAGSAYGGMVSGVVTYNGIPQAGKRLIFVDNTRRMAQQSMSDGRGYYAILLPPGFFVLQIDGRGCGPVQSSSQPVRRNVEMRHCR